MTELVSLLAELLPAVFGPGRVDPRVVVAVAAVFVALAAVFICKAIPAIFDAGGRLVHTVGRRISQHKIVGALAQRGAPQDLLQGLATLNEASPLDAPDAHLRVAPGTVTAIPHPRTRKTPPRLVVHHHTPKA